MVKKLFKIPLELVKVFDYLDYKPYLKDLYLATKAEEDGYTYIKFSKDLGLTETNVSSHIINNRRPLTSDGALKVVKAIGLTKQDRKYFLALVDYINEDDSTKRDKMFHDLFSIKQSNLPEVLQEQMTYFSKWYFPVIGELARVEGFQCDYQWVKKNLWPRLTPKEFDASIEFLEKVRILSKDENGSKQRTDLDFSPGQATKNISVKKYHQQMLKLADQGLTNVEESKRHYSAMTIVLGEEEASELNELILEFQRKVAELESQSQKRESVYQINLQLFPLGKGNDIWKK